MTAWLRLTLLGTGAMNSPRYPPAGPLAAWLVSDERSKLRVLAVLHGVQSAAAATPAQDIRSCQQARSLWRRSGPLGVR